MAVAGAALVVLLIATQVPLVPAPVAADGRRGMVPLDTWAAAHFPIARDVYRQHFAALLLPRRLPLLMLFGVLFVSFTRGFPQRPGTWLAERMPPLSARAMGLFRLCLGLALAAAVHSEIPRAVPLAVQRSTSWLARLEVIRHLAADPDAVQAIWVATILLFLCFAAGLWARVALASAATTLTLFVGIELTAKALHDWGLPLITVWLLTLAPWHDSTGAQTLVARWLGRPARSVSPAWRGLAIWIPGLTIGVAFAAAAFAKLDTSGFAWISSGAVRFHFVEDARQAPVDWGLWVARSSVAGIATSAAAIAIEAGFWLVTLTTRLDIRALFGLVGVSFLIGFYLFQGVFWPAWWTLFLAFVPWPAVDRAFGGLEERPPGVEPIPILASAAIALLVLQQPLISALRVESEPFLSDYSMYSYTWPSAAAFDEHLRGKTTRYELVGDGPDGEIVGQRVRDLPRGFDIVTDAIGVLDRGETWSPATRAAVDGVRRTYLDRFGAPLSRVTVNVWQRGFDWQHGTFDDQLTASRVLDLERERIDDVR